MSKLTVRLLSTESTMRVTTSSSGSLVYPPPAINILALQPGSDNVIFIESLDGVPSDIFYNGVKTNVFRPTSSSYFLTEQAGPIPRNFILTAETGSTPITPPKTSNNTWLWILLGVIIAIIIIAIIIYLIKRNRDTQVQSV